MIKINLLCVGTLKERFWVDAIEEYKKRIGRFANFKITETDECRTIEEEGKEILKRIKGHAVIFDIEGEAVTSCGFAEMIRKKLNEGKSELTLIIGGSNGLSQEVKDISRDKISFGRVTYPHQLMRVIATEQVYRALTILNNVPYHK